MHKGEEWGKLKLITVWRAKAQQSQRPTLMHNGGPVGFYAESSHRLISVSKTMLATVSQLVAK